MTSAYQLPTNGMAMAFSAPFAIDTNAFSLLLRGDTAVAELVSHAELIAMPIVVAAELRAGFAYGGKTKQYGAILDDFLSDPSTALLHISEDTVAVYAELYATARKQGRQLSNNDLWIAALCVQHNYPLLTFDKDFDALPSLRRRTV